MSSRTVAPFKTNIKAPIGTVAVNAAKPTNPTSSPLTAYLSEGAAVNGAAAYYGEDDDY